jgi:aryl-alcohol dehydrogenase-like predicted oxidoreductase
VKYGSIQGLGDRVSRLALGTMTFSPDRQEQADELLDAFVAAGGNLLDTARGYGRGASEEAIGNWIHSRGGRDRVVIMSKGVGRRDDGSFLIDPEMIAEAVDESLERMRVDTVDLYVLHKDDPSAPVGEIVEALNEQVRAGRITAFGGSNWSHRRIAEANAYAAAKGLRPFVVSSPNVALAVPKEPMWAGCISLAGDEEALAWYREHAFPVLPWSAQASGFFSGRFSPDEQVDPSAPLNPVSVGVKVTYGDMARVYYSDENWERLRRARELAERKGCSPTQLALAWVLHQPFPTFPLVGPVTVPQLEDCLGALAVDLTPAEAAWLNLERVSAPA